MANKTGLTADRRLYLDKDGKVVEHDDPSKSSLLVAQGGLLSNEDAARYGITQGEDGKIVFGAASENETAVDAESAEGEGQASDLESLSVVDLKERAKEMGLTGYSALSKKELIKAIEAGPQEEE